MIVRTYGRRTRCAGRGFSDGDLLDGGAEADEPLSLSSQEAGGSQSDPYGFAAFSSQDSSPWSLDSDLFVPDEFAAAPAALPPLPPPRPPGDSSNGLPRVPKDRKGVKAKKPELPAPGRPPRLPVAVATLMENQEGGEMMEHVDEVNFALDGLGPGQPTRVRQASLLSLLNVCANAPRRRFLRAQGMSKRIIDAILGLRIDDSASSIAAAALFYVLTSDVPGDCLLDSPSCIHFLLKLLNPPAAGSVEGKVPNIGHRLSGIGNAVSSNGMNKRVDSSSTSIISKVQEILLSCKELKPSSQDDDTTGRPELSSKWIALLTIQKACLSTISIEDTSGTVCRVGGNFKERLRELGGLDAIFAVAVSCYSTMKGWLRNSFPSFREFKSGDLQSIILLLKCFKIMENATFLSRNNQDHLLGMRTKVDNEGSPLSFVRLVISAIKLFSDLSFHQTYPCISVKKPNCLSKDDCSCASSADSDGHCSSERSAYTKRSGSCQKRQKLESEVSIADSKTTVAYAANVSSSKTGKDLYPLISCNGKLVGSRGELSMDAKLSNVNPMRGSSGWISIKISQSKVNTVTRSAEHFTTDGDELKGAFLNQSNGDFSTNCSGSRMSSVHLRKRCLSTAGTMDECMRSTYDPFTFDEVDGNGSTSTSTGLEDRFNISEETREKCTISAHDPFAFDEDDLGPSKWEMLAKRKETSENSQSMVFDWELENGPELLLSSDPESTKEKNKNSDNPCPFVAEEDPNLLEDCLLTAVKVLMNLTNDNPVGCQQIASCGGLDTLASLITSHFPSFDFHPVRNQLDESTSVSQSSADAGPLKNKYLSDHELDFLVAILGLLVNLVEKDVQNRSRLASASVSIAHSGRPEDSSCMDVISLLCSIFLANRDAGEATGEGSLLPCDDEAAFLQGEREAEMMIIEAYAALLLAFLSTESKKSREAIANCLPDHNLEVLVPVLERFVAFHVSLNMISPETHSIVSEVIGSCKGS